MILYATDYDGTVSPHTGEELEKTIADWQAAGNLFVVVTGRPMASIRSTLLRQKFRPDYVVCDNGALVATSDYRIKWYRALNPADIVKALEYLRDYVGDGPRIDAVEGHLSAYCVPDKLDVTDDGRGLVFGSTVFGDVIEFCCIYKEKDVNLSMNEAVEKLTGGRLTGKSSSRMGSDYVAAGVSKAAGIKKLIEIAEIEPDKIIATGDAYNDIEMLVCPEIEGYVVENGLESVKEQVGRTVESPITLMRRYLN
ncbi:MAG: Cof-type HAD-IIB family hydrolase [Clostridia bacterium]|nr:Cof-type HAD-IIB family hydrolase [Clostridia bacterium]